MYGSVYEAERALKYKEKTGELTLIFLHFCRKKRAKGVKYNHVRAHVIRAYVSVDIERTEEGAMATASSTKRLRQDYLRLQRDPVPYVEATPLPSNILEWFASYLLCLYIIVYSIR